MFCNIPPNLVKPICASIILLQTDGGNICKEQFIINYFITLYRELLRTSMILDL